MSVLKDIIEIAVLRKSGLLCPYENYYSKSVVTMFFLLLFFVFGLITICITSVLQTPWKNMGFMH